MPVRFVFAVHCHQPIGNFDSVFAQAYADAYQPLLELFGAHPQFPFVVHLSGCLLEWLETHRRSFVRDLHALVQRGQVELLGGAYYEPILPMLPRRDRRGQIRRFSEHLHGVFGVRVRGLWLAERVWEPSLAGDLVEEGIEYTLLDDHHFRQAGLPASLLHQPFLTEDEGHLLKVFPISEPLRYLIPWKTPAETVRYLTELQAEHPGALAICADDGEKYGAWPGTHELCYRKGWLTEFLSGLQEIVDAGKLRFQTLAKTADETRSAPLTYLPDCSYREMTEWALPVARQEEYARAVEWLDGAAVPEAQLAKSFLRGGLWRNFRAKYPEVREMYARMLKVSERVDEARQTGHAAAAEAELELYRAQCNCAYWHGAFGGLYLPHLRNAVYSHLIAAENLLLSGAVRSGKQLEIENRDLDMDGERDVRISNDSLSVAIAPRRGGVIFSLESRPHRLNLQAGLARRPEAYHQAIRTNAARQEGKNVVSLVEETVQFKHPGLEKLLNYDVLPRHSFIEHFWPSGIDREEARTAHTNTAAVAPLQAYTTDVHKDQVSARVQLQRSTRLAGQLVQVRKQVSLQPGSDRIELAVALEPAPEVAVRLGLEFMFAGLAAGQPDRYYVLPKQERAGMLDAELAVEQAAWIALVDEWRRLRVTLAFDRPATIWTWPQQTVSQSEGGFEAVYQGSIVIPSWLPEPGQRWEVRLSLRCESIAAG